MKKDKLHNAKSTGFKTPDNYFESIEDKFFEHLSEKKVIDSIEDSGYTLPKDYFNTVEDKVLGQLNSEEKPVVKLNSRKSFYYIAGIAASLIVLFAIFINNTKPEEISVEMVENYLENRDLDSYELAQLLSDEDLLEDDFTIAATPYEEDNLESYLLDNVDIETYLE
jgi:hypothetical protein